MLCILTAMGSYGDVHPMIGLGVALRARGHDVKVVTNPFFADVVHEAGLPFVGVSTLQDYERMTNHKDLWNPRRSFKLVFQEGAIGCMRELYEIVTTLNRPGETVIGAHGLDLASRLFAETSDAPVASACFSPFVLWSRNFPPRLPAGLGGPWTPNWLKNLQFKLGEQLFVQPHIVKPLNAFRRELSLQPLRGSFWDWYYGVAPPLCLFPEWFASQADWPHGTVTTNFPLWDGSEVRELSDEAIAFLEQGSPPIVFTPGSARKTAQEFFAASTHACRTLGRRGVLLTKYPEQTPANLPDTVRVLGFQPLSQVLSRSAAFVHHGGIGSCAQGLAAGIPQVIQPEAYDQFDNSERVCRFGVAEEITTYKFKGPNLEAALERLLTSDKKATAARNYADRIRNSGGLDLACEALEQSLNTV